MKRWKGFTLIEVMMVATVVSLAVAVAVPNYVYSKEFALFNTCANNRRAIERAEGQFVLDNDRHSIGITFELKSKGYIEDDCRCSSGGIYYWVAYPISDYRYRTVLGCSIHGADKSVNANIENLGGEEE